MSRLSHACLALALLIAILWTRGLFVVDEIYLNCFGRLCIVGSFPNHADLILYPTSYHGPIVALLPHSKKIPSMPAFWEPRFVHNTTRTELAIPWWLITIFLLPAPAWAMVENARRQKRIQQSRCPECGYDLRATPIRCPECGAVPATGEESKTRNSKFE